MTLQPTPALDPTGFGDSVFLVRRLPEEPSIISANGDTPLLGHHGSLSGAACAMDLRSVPSSLEPLNEGQCQSVSRRRPKKKVS